MADLINKAKPQEGRGRRCHAASTATQTPSRTRRRSTRRGARLGDGRRAARPRDHGFPARLLVPGIYGMKHVKWLTTIELVNYDFKGFWQQPDQGWSDPALVRTMSKIDYPAAGALKLQPQTFSGIAFAGDRSISKVEISTDGGKTWAEAYIKPKLSDTAWVVWGYNWPPPNPASTPSWSAPPTAKAPCNPPGAPTPILTARQATTRLPTRSSRVSRLESSTRQRARANGRRANWPTC